MLYQYKKDNFYLSYIFLIKGGYFMYDDEFLEYFLNYTHESLKHYVAKYFSKPTVNITECKNHEDFKRKSDMYIEEDGSIYLSRKTCDIKKELFKYKDNYYYYNSLDVVNEQLCFLLINEEIADRFLMDLSL